LSDLSEIIKDFNETLQAKDELDREKLTGLAEKLSAFSDEHASLTKNYEQLKAKLEERETSLTKSLEQEKAAVSRLLLDAGLTNELSKNNVKPSLLAAAKALIREKGILQIVGENDVRKAVARIQRNGAETTCELSEWVKDFLASDEGKEFVAAKANSGGGAGEPVASGRTGDGSSMSSKKFWGMPARERAAFMAQGGTILPD